jgi:hypothetical protein
MKNTRQKRFVKGHDFSHADKVNRISRALAAGLFPFTSTQLCQQSGTLCVYSFLGLLSGWPMLGLLVSRFITARAWAIIIGELGLEDEW